KQWLVWLLL
nr:Chain C, Protein-cysteine N-palmitoyltransferase HHAT [Homo sapiens]6UK2_C Chain C, Protein-cysteine N-palmitoyltransferase HHAT [Homo sapiens]